MTIPTVSINESSPAGSDNISAGDNRIREYKTQNREILEVDHNYQSSGQDPDAGKHKKCSFIEQADLGTGAEGKPILGAQTVSGKAELVFTDEDDNDIQITSGGEIAPPTSPTLANWAGVLGLVYPVGSVYTNATDSTNPATLLGFGTWVAIEGECIVGYASGDAEFGSVGSVAEGEKEHTLVEDEIPSHNHTVSFTDQETGGSARVVGGVNNQTSTFNTGSTGGGSGHNNIQPSYVCYVWRRTA
jgi:hypothetical protein